MPRRDDGDEPTDDELRRFDRNRKDKKVSNRDWKAKADDDARIVKMKDGRTHFGYKAEHAVDLETEVVLSARVQHGTEADSQTLAAAVIDAQANLVRSGSDAEIQDVAADKGYHSNDQITDCTALGVRTYISEPSARHNRRWTDKPDHVKAAVLNNRRRTRRSRSKQLQRLRSETVERSFAHVCETGGARRTWLRGLDKINKRYSMVVAAHNLGLEMRNLFGSGKPRQSASTGALAQLFLSLLKLITHLKTCFRRCGSESHKPTPQPQHFVNGSVHTPHGSCFLNFSTDC